MLLLFVFDLILTDAFSTLGIDPRYAVIIKLAYE